MSETILKMYSLDVFGKQLEQFIRKRWGLKRLFTWLNIKAPYFGETIILMHILNISNSKNKHFKRSAINKVINSFDEKLESEVKNNLRGFAIK